MTKAQQIVSIGRALELAKKQIFRTPERMVPGYLLNHVRQTPTYEHYGHLFYNQSGGHC